MDDNKNWKLGEGDSGGRGGSRGGDSSGRGGSVGGDPTVVNGVGCKGETGLTLTKIQMVDNNIITMFVSLRCDGSGDFGAEFEVSYGSCKVRDGPDC
ncbi:unnamed protein product [Microthlaspi erraticum]|uniref:Uncharacterized protein n=1 Tax=Microthlaspi erraticum TaxID=1685480 RepID=A0A6D2JCA8_9BRAS|nr:unnamed protein product [Microthlaspi erraticum]